MAECLRQTALNRWDRIRKRSFAKNVFMFTRGVTKAGVSDANRNCLAGV